MKRLFAFLLVLCMVLTTFAACGNSNNSANSGGTTANPSEPSTSQAEPEPEIPYTPNPLTGLEKEADYPNGKTPVAIMVNNISACWPQRGISEADIIYEMVTEGGITRLMAVFSDYTTVPVTGPVRSARDQHVQLMFPYQALYVHIGASVIAEQLLDQYDYSQQNMDGKYYSSMWWRDQARLNAGYATEHTAYTDGEHITATVDANNMVVDFEPKPIFNFVKYYDAPRVLEGGDAQSMRIIYTPNSYYITSFTYDVATNKYKKSQAGAPHVDENNGAQLAFDNVFICFADITHYPDTPLAKVDYRYGGLGYYFYGGKYEKIRWVKGLPEQPLRFYNENGDEVDIEVNCGKTYVGFSDYTNYDTFVISGSTDGVGNENVTIDPTQEVEVAD
ncbi:MAG: DUF3048 domain-containing protein [Oscillospiraceae bacterium]|nr:DUF3048 domain-containing protein [Oscillospiraceae bacterium]